MPHIIAKNISVVFPLVGSDAQHGLRLKNSVKRSKTSVGGKIILEDNLPVGVLAIDRFSMDIRSGARIGLHGANGSGKSTLLRTLGGIYPPTSGYHEISGKVTSMFSLNLGVNNEATGLANIRIKGLMQGLSNREIDRLIPEITEFSELGDYLHMPVKTYSSGMKMRLLFSTACAFKPDIMLLDEWVSAGDAEFKKKVDEKLEELMMITPIIIIASHNYNRLSTWANQMVKLDQGRAHFE